MHREVLEPDKVLVIHDFLSSEECADLIRRSKGLRYERGTVADVVIEDVRNNDRVLVDDLSLASDLFLRRAEPSLESLLVDTCRWNKAESCATGIRIAAVVVGWRCPTILHTLPKSQKFMIWSGTLYYSTFPSKRLLIRTS